MGRCEQSQPQERPLRHGTAPVKRPQVRLDLLLRLHHERPRRPQRRLALGYPDVRLGLVLQRRARHPRRLHHRQVDQLVDRAPRDSERHRRLVVGHLRGVAVGRVLPVLCRVERVLRQHVLRGHVLVDHAHVVAPRAPQSRHVPGVDGHELAFRHHERGVRHLAGGLVHHLGGGIQDEVPGRVEATARERPLVGGAPAFAFAPRCPPRELAVGRSQARAHEVVPVVADLVRERRVHLPQHERVDLRVDLHAPADRTVDRAGVLDRLDLAPRRHVLAAQLLRQGVPVEPRVGHQLGDPVGQAPKLLRLVAACRQLLLDVRDALGHRGLLEFGALVDDFLSYHASQASCARFAQRILPNPAKRHPQGNPHARP